MAPNIKKPLLDQETLALLLATVKGPEDGAKKGASPEDAGAKKGANKLRSQGKAGEEEEDLDPSDISSICTYLVRALLILTKKVHILEGQAGGVDGAGAGNQGLEERLRAQEDELDEVKQRSLKGNLILSSSKGPGGNLKCEIKSDDQLKSLGVPLLAHVQDLVHRKYGVQVPKEDVQACHRLPNGSIILRLWKRTEDSAWTQLIGAIKTGGSTKSLNFYANFHLTHRRNSLVYELRQLKKDGKIFKFYTDENGAISYRSTQQDNKCKITYHRKRANSKAEKTLSKTELVNSLS